jgi:hypothetical protein
MERPPFISQLLESAMPWVYRVSMYASNAFLEDPAILAFAFC